MTNPKDGFRERINQADGRFTHGDRKIADHLLRTYPAGLLESASAMARRLDLHVSTVTRFFPKIGYANIRTVHQDVREAMDFLMASPLNRTPERVRSAKDDTSLFQRVLRLDIKNIQETFQDLSHADARTFVRLLLDPERSVYVFGARKHFSLCFYTFNQLNAVREDVFLAPTGNFYVADVLTRVRSHDILWLFDFRRYPRLSGKVAEYFKNVGATVALFTDSPLAPSAGFADLRFVSATNGVSSFDSYAACVSLINAFLAEYVRRAPDTVRKRYEIQEALFQHFDIFTWQERIPARPRSR